VRNDVFLLQQSCPKASEAITLSSYCPLDTATFPPDYIAGKKYPLVIQTHGFDSQGFVIDGDHISASAAQPLAGKGIVVLQMNDIFYDSLDTAQELERAMSAYENAVNYLDEKGIIDRSRVGLVGFSRTCLYVKYTLTHSTQHFAAAIAAEGFDDR
jgi:predicted peptidase